MYSLDKDQTVLNVLAADMYYNFIRKNSEDTIVDHFNLEKVRMAPPHFCL